MQYFYYKSGKGNLGDDINPWLWSKIFGNENLDDNSFLLGIGTILQDSFPGLKDISHSDKKKIVFGSGIRYDYKPFILNESWDIKFLRGELSAKFLGNKYPYIADAAYCIRQIAEFENIKRTEKKYKVGLMPHIASLQYVNWEQICNQLGYKFISPLCKNGFEETLKEIAACECIISEAMHGAIFADIFRVPWSRFIFSANWNEGNAISEFKWNDWLSAILPVGQLKSSYIKLYRSNKIDSALLRLTGYWLYLGFAQQRKITNQILEHLQKCQNEFYLSDDKVINNIDEKLFDVIASLKRSI